MKCTQQFCCICLLNNHQLQRGLDCSMFWIKNTILLLCDEAIVSYYYWLAVITIWFHCSLTKLLYASWFLSSVTTTWPVKNLSGGGTGVVICLEWDADMHMAQLMPLPLTISCFSKIQIRFTFLVPAHPGSPGCVCVCYYDMGCQPYVIMLRNICLYRTWTLLVNCFYWLIFILPSPVPVEARKTVNSC